MLNELIRAAKTINGMSDRSAFFAAKQIEDQKKANKIIASSGISNKFARRLAGFQAGEVVVKNYKERISNDTSDFTTLKFEVNLRNLIRKGYAEVKDGNLVLTLSGEKWLAPLTETTCIFTGSVTTGRF
jgi:hypothetical protein